MPPKKYIVPRPAIAADFTQPKERKPRKSMPRQAGISDAEWRVDASRREAVITDRWRRLDAKRIRDATRWPIKKRRLARG
ncbi:hypothetical protein D1007_16635 [Hordeum vulgare]|nr:hypothetical protein D1007_16635 [Hordeum vulgare]